MLIAQPWPWHGNWWRILVAVDRGQTHFLVLDRGRRERLPRAGGSEKDYSARGLPGLAVKPTGHESASSRCSR